MSEKMIVYKVVKVNDKGEFITDSYEDIVGVPTTILKYELNKRTYPNKSRQGKITAYNNSFVAISEAFRGGDCFIRHIMDLGGAFGRFNGGADSETYMNIGLEDRGEVVLKCEAKVEKITPIGWGYVLCDWVKPIEVIDRKMAYSDKYKKQQIEERKKLYKNRHYEVNYEYVVEYNLDIDIKMGMLTPKTIDRFLIGMAIAKHGGIDEIESILAYKMEQGEMSRSSYYRYLNKYKKYLKEYIDLVSYAILYPGAVKRRKESNGFKEFFKRYDPKMKKKKKKIEQMEMSGMYLYI